MNLVNNYINFNKLALTNYATILCTTINENESKILEEYIDNYIQVYYFHIFQTINKKDFKRFNYKVLLKEFEGKRLELIYENKGTKELVDALAIIALISIKLKNLKELTKSKVETTIKRFKLNLSKEYITELFDLLVENKQKEEKFFKSLEYEHYDLEYKLYRNKTNKYNVSLKYDIKVLSYRYLESSIDKNFNKEDLAIQKFETILYLLSIDILYRIKNSEELDIYFIDLPSILLNDSSINNILNKIYNKYFSENISFLVNYNDYINHKRILNNLDVKYSFAAYVDMSHINFIEKKIETIESIDLFDYGILDKVKPKDYETIIKYQLKGKEIFNNEFVKGDK